MQVVGWIRVWGANLIDCREARARPRQCGAMAVDRRLSTAQVIVQLACFSRHLIRSFDQNVQTLFEDIEGRIFRRLVFLQWLRRYKFEPVKGTRDYQPPVILADLHLDAFEWELAAPRTIGHYGQGKLAGFRLGKLHDVKPRYRIGAIDALRGGCRYGTLEGPLHCLKQARSRELCAQVRSETFMSS